MKGIFLSMICLGGAALLSWGGLCFYSGKKYFKVFIGVFFLVVFLYVIFYSMTSDNLGFIPDSLIEPSKTVDFINGLVWLSLLFHLFWDGMYMFFLTGFSTGMLYHLMVNRKRGMTEEELIEIYGGDLGGSPVIQNRIWNLEKGGYIRKGDEGGYHLTRKGETISKMTIFFQKALQIQEVG